VKPLFLSGGLNIVFSQENAKQGYSKLVAFSQENTKLVSQCIDKKKQFTSLRVGNYNQDKWPMVT
jgi:hypothetical protein